MNPSRPIRWALLGTALILAACTARPTVTNGPTLSLSSPSASPHCGNSPPDAATIIALDPADRLACFGDASLTFAAVVGMPITDCGMGRRIAAGFCLPGVVLLAPNAGEASAGLAAYWDLPAAPTATTPPALVAGTSVRVTGHLDDATAQMCHLSSGPPGQPTQPPTEVVLSCREEFIVDAVVTP
jgi:hypothetical protein